MLWYNIIYDNVLISYYDIIFRYGMLWYKCKVAVIDSEKLLSREPTKDFPRKNGRIRYIDD